MPTGLYVAKYGTSANWSGLTTLAPNIYDLTVGDTTTFHSSTTVLGGAGSRTAYFTWDLLAVVPLDQIRGALRSVGDTTPARYALFGSEDGSSWTQILANTNVTPATTTAFNRTFTEVSYRYVRLSVEGTVADGGTAGGTCYDFRIYIGGSEYVVGSGRIKRVDMRGGKKTMQGGMQ